jgi:hypothetical protein
LCQRREGAQASQECKLRYGPKYLLTGSRLTDDTYLLRALLNGLNSWGREWGETLVVLDNGSLDGLENEVEAFRCLEHRKVDGVGNPNMVIAFMDRMSESRKTEEQLRDAASRSIPVFVIGNLV